MRSVPFWLPLSAIAAACIALHADAAPAPPDVPVESDAGDLLRQAPAGKTKAAPRRPQAAATALDPADVGDADSFGRAVKWLGVAQMQVTLDSSCPKPDPASDSACVVLAAAPGFTGFALEDVARLTLPAEASHSILCHWFSPLLTLQYANPTATPVVARLNYMPSLTVENPVLDDPSLIDASTGLPFGGRLTATMSASERFEVPLSPGMSLTSTERDTATCIAGFLTRRSLVQHYGLPPELAEKFFAKPTILRMNLRGSAQYVGYASMTFGLRVVGD